MSINQLIISTLNPVGLPISLRKYTGDQQTYITFFEYNQNSALDADDEEQQTAHYVQVDVWSKTNYTSIVDDVKQRLIAAGFRRTSEMDLYEDDTKIYHKALRFVTTL